MNIFGLISTFCAIINHAEMNILNPNVIPTKSREVQRSVVSTLTSAS